MDDVEPHHGTCTIHISPANRQTGHGTARPLPCSIIRSAASRRRTVGWEWILREGTPSIGSRSTSTTTHPTHNDTSSVHGGDSIVVKTPISKFKIRSRVHTPTTAERPHRRREHPPYKPAPQHHSDPSVDLLPPPPRPNPLPSPSSRRATTDPRFAGGPEP
jgi:hypothetical protein